MNRALVILLSLLTSLPSFSASLEEQKASLGRQLYFDKNLSFNKTQSCASCHDPTRGFVDATQNASHRAASLGDDGKSLGDRNAPTASYANQIPPFHKTKEGNYVGGQFWDGRASTLAEQAAGPPLNQIEMGMPNKTLVAERLNANPGYHASFKAIYGDDIVENADQLYSAMADAIASFEQSNFFSPFDSKYDRYLRGEYQLNSKEELGMTLFFSEQFTNCNQCHQLKKRPMTEGETFSDYTYHNIGVPRNRALRILNGIEESTQDEGLLANPKVNDSEQKGKFKVPTLRNVAITGPYMHNGVFKELRTVVAFYNKYNSKSQQRQINPETGLSWAEPEVRENVSVKELEHGPALDDKRIDALVAFMKLLTDKRYEHLIR